MLTYHDSPEFLLLRKAGGRNYHPNSPKLLDQARAVLRRQHYARRTEETYVHWIIRFIHFHNMRHPQDMDTPDIEAFLNHLAVKQQVSASTQNQAFSALLFLYKHVLDKPLSAKIEALRAKPSRRLPTVLSQSETKALLKALSGTHQLIARLLYGSGLRLMEGLRLRVKDIDFAQHQIIVRAGKGDKDRVTILPDTLRLPLEQHLQQVKARLKKTWLPGTAMFTRPTLVNTPTLTANGAGSTFFPPTAYRLIRVPARCDVIISMRVVCVKRSNRQPNRWASSSRSVHIPSATVSPPICSKTAMISALCQNCSATKAWKRP